MGDPTAESVQARTWRLRALAQDVGIFGDVQRWPGKTRWYAAAFEGTTVVRICAHLHRDERSARKCAAALVLKEAADYDARGRLFS